MKKKLRKQVSVILMFCLVFTQLPMTAFAARAEETQKTPSKETAVFDLGGGLKQTVFYGNDVRFREKDGSLTDYEPELIEIKDNSRKQGKDLSGFAWKNKRGDTQQYFPKVLSADSPVLMEKIIMPLKWQQGNQKLYLRRIL